MFVLIVASDEISAREVTAALEVGGDATTLRLESVAAAGSHGATATVHPDAVILVGDGEKVAAVEDCAVLRQEFTHCPILVLAASPAERDIVACLDSGASDVVTLPYRPAELRARLRAQIRAFANSAEHVFQIGPHRFEPATRSLMNGLTSETVRLTHKENEVLKYLCRAGGGTVSRTTMLREVWGYKEGADSYTVESHIYRLRRKLEADPARPCYILSEEGGYALLGSPPRSWPPLRAVPPVSLAG